MSKQKTRKSKFFKRIKKFFASINAGRRYWEKKRQERFRKKHRAALNILRKIIK